MQRREPDLEDQVGELREEVRFLRSEISKLRREVQSLGSGSLDSRLEAEESAASERSVV